jgi:transposase
LLRPWLDFTFWIGNAQGLLTFWDKYFINRNKLVILRFPHPQQNKFVMPRLMLSDAFWSKLEKILLQETIYNKCNLRMTVEGMLYRMRVGCPWRDLPKAFGCWNSIYKRFNAWSSSNKWGRIFKALTIDSDWEWEFIDGGYVKVHQHSSGAVGQEAASHREKPCAGNTTKIHLVVDSLWLASWVWNHRRRSQWLFCSTRFDCQVTWCGSDYCG